MGHVQFVTGGRCCRSHTHRRGYLSRILIFTRNGALLASWQGPEATANGYRSRG